MPCKKKFVSHSVEARNPRSGHRHGPVRAHVEVTDFPLCPHMAEGAEDLSGVSFLRALTPFMWAPPSGPNRPSKAPPPNTTHWGLGFQHGFWGDADSPQHGPVCCRHRLGLWDKAWEPSEGSLSPNLGMTEEDTEEQKGTDGSHGENMGLLAPGFFWAPEPCCLKWRPCCVWSI